MKKLLIVLLVATVTTPALATMVPKVAPPVRPVLGTSSAFGSGAAATTGFLGFVALLAGYDLWRRSFCVGDPLGLGGPGFSEPYAGGNVMIPKCMRR